MMNPDRMLRRHLATRFGLRLCSLVVGGGILAATWGMPAVPGETSPPSDTPAVQQAAAHVHLAQQLVAAPMVQGSAPSSRTAKRGGPMEIRRVVTGHTADGKAVVIRDDVVMGLPVAGGDAEFAVVWKTVQAPVDNDDPTDRSGEPTGLVEPNGSILRMVDLAPHTRSPMHRTDSLDYGIVLTGEVDIELDGGKLTRIRQGDVIVQRGTIHAWVNPGPSTCRIAFILLGAKPATVNGRPLPSVMGNISPDK